MLLLVAEAIFCSQVDYRVVEDWKLAGNWKISSVIAFLTTVLEAAVAYAVASCLGQLRWLWFQKGQELRWMDRLTNARQPPGAAYLLISPDAWRHWAGLGGFLVLALLGVNVFTQQIVGQEYQPYNTTKSYVPIAYTWLERYEPGDEPGNEQPHADMAAAIISGFLAPNALYRETVVGSGSVSCPSGNCTFLPFYSLATCRTCRDITDTIIFPKCQTPECEQDGQDSRIRLSTVDLSLDRITGIVNITSDLQYPDNSSISGVGPLLAHYFGLGLSHGDYAIANATECAIYWCAEFLSSSVNSSEFSEKAIGHPPPNITTTATTNLVRNDNITIMPPGCFLTKPDESSKGRACVFTVDAPSHRALQNFLVGDSNKTGFLNGESYKTGANHEYWSTNSTAADAIVAPCSNRAYNQDYDCSSDMFANLDSSIYGMTKFHGIRNEDRLAFIKLANQQQKEEAYRKWSVVLENENGLQVFRKVERLGMELREGEVKMHATLDGMAERPVHFAEEIGHAALAAGFESV
ncbi:hypothetical protein LTR86_007970 [Recurvomyces mirabilis]|nr:hypothetical protein LTR86_007970 [Recurvomyces mirabilis]